MLAVHRIGRNIAFGSKIPLQSNFNLYSNFDSWSINNEFRNETDVTHFA